MGKSYCSITLRYSPSLGVIDDEPLRALARDHEIIDIREYFFIVEQLPHLLCLVSYGPKERRPPAPAKPEPESAPPGRPRATDQPRDFDEHQRKLFDEIRTWRISEADQRGVPRYVVLNNRDVEALVRAQPRTRADLARVPGIGDAKIRRYADALLELLNPTAKPEAPEAPTADEPEPKERPADEAPPPPA